MIDILIMIMEWIGTVAFAVSGSLVAIGCSLDLFGVVIVGCITAVGGGIMRDIILGNIPPLIFSNINVLIMATITTLIVFAVAYMNTKKFEDLREKIEKINVFFDAVGLAAFSVTGVEIVFNAQGMDNPILAITLGVMTGVGGGVLRDVLVNEKPYILTKHIYAVASMLGSTIYYVLSILGYQIVGTFVAVTVTIVIRLLAAKYHWQLPKIKFSDDI